MKTITNKDVEVPVLADQYFTSRPFTIAVCCASCAPDVADAVMPRLREVVRNCPQAVLVVAKTLLGQIADASMGSDKGVLLVLQPCNADRAPVSPVRWVGPVRTEAEARSVCDWIAGGDWSRMNLPPSLRLEAKLERSSRAN